MHLSRNEILYEYTETGDEQLVLAVKGQMKLKNMPGSCKETLQELKFAKQTNSKIKIALEYEESKSLLHTLLRYGIHFRRLDLMKAKVWVKSVVSVHCGVRDFCSVICV